MDYTEQYSQWLSAYLDGELDPALEEPLFAALATHGELRQELSELLALRRAVRNDLVALVPPMSTSAAVFQSLGIGVGATVATSLLRKVWLPLASAIVGGALTWLGMTMLTPPPAAPAPQVPLQVSMPVAPPETTFVERVVYRTQVVQPRSDMPIVAASEMSSAPAARVTTPEPNQSAPSPRQTALLAELPEMRFTPSPLVIRRIDHSLTPPPDVATIEDPQLPQLPEPELYPQFRLLVRGLGTTSLVTVPQQPDRNSLLSTSAIGLQYTLSENHAIGIEVGREPFAMQFYGYTEDTRLRYEAYPALLWGVATYQYRRQVGRYVEPFVQIGIGATEFGLLGRSTLGVVYRPAPSLGVMIGLEGALMRYVHQSVPYWTPNIGITYGVVFRF